LVAYHQHTFRQFASELERRASSMEKNRLFVVNLQGTRVFLLDSSIYRVNGCFRLPFNCKKGLPHILKPIPAPVGSSHSMEEKLSIIHKHLFGVMEIPGSATFLDQLGVSGSRQSQSQGMVAPSL
jgi:hypothetical protein